MQRHFGQLSLCITKMYYRCLVRRSEAKGQTEQNHRISKNKKQIVVANSIDGTKNFQNRQQNPVQYA